MQSKPLYGNCSSVMTPAQCCFMKMSEKTSSVSVMVGSIR